jgi:transcriptional regulator with XRE-family HTH domain
MLTLQELGRRIARARQHLGLTQTAFGRLLSRPRSHAAISDMERGKTKLDIEELSEVARVLNKPLSFFTETGERVDTVYRHSDELSSDRQRLIEQSVEAFKRVAREKRS